MKPRILADGPTASARLAVADVAELARQGVTLVINNCPDGQAPGQLGAARGGQAALQAGLAGRHMPATRATLRVEDVDRFGDALAAATGPVHAHRVSGSRSATVRAPSRIRRGTMTRAEAARRARRHRVDRASGLAWLDRQPT